MIFFGGLTLALLAVRGVMAFDDYLEKRQTGGIVRALIRDWVYRRFI